MTLKEQVVRLAKRSKKQGKTTWEILNAIPVDTTYESVRRTVYALRQEGKLKPVAVRYNEVAYTA